MKFASRWIFPMSLAVILVFAALGQAAWCEEFSQENAEKSLGSWSIAAIVSGLGSDWGAGTQLCTPTLGSSALGLVLSFMNYNYEPTASSTPAYSLLGLGLSTHNVVSEKTRVYERLGFNAVLPTDDLSSKVGMDMQLVLGLEFFPLHKDSVLSFFGELGFTLPIVQSYANQIAGTPHYGSGALTSVGARLYF